MGNSYSRVAPSIEQGILDLPAPKKYSRSRDLSPAQPDAVLPENVFHSMLTLERRRAQRSSKAFVLMLLDAKQENGAAAGILRRAIDVALISKRETDLLGWYKENAVLGVIFIEVNLEGNHPVIEILRVKIEAALIKHLGRETAGKITISAHVFPETERKNHSGRLADLMRHSDFDPKAARRALPIVIRGR